MKEKQEKDRETEVENQALLEEEKTIFEQLNFLKEYSLKMVDTSLKEQYFNDKNIKIDPIICIFMKLL